MADLYKKNIIKSYKTIEDLEWAPRLGGVQGLIKFNNGYGASVISGSMFYSNGIDTYEIACLDDNGNVCYPGGSFTDVCGYRTRDEINDLLKEIQDYPPINFNKHRLFCDEVSFIEPDQD